MSVRTDGETEVLGGRLDRAIEVGALRAGDFDFFRGTEGRKIIVVEIERDLAGGNGRVLA